MVALNQYLGGTGLNPVRTFMIFKASFFFNQLNCSLPARNMTLFYFQSVGPKHFIVKKNEPSFSTINCFK